MRKWMMAAGLIALCGCGPAPADRPADSPAADTQAPAPASSVTQTAPAPSAPERGPELPANACLVQDGKTLAANAIRAVGTEPFWAATVVGRCVTYSTPEDQDGTRIWTRFEGSASSGRWAGALDRQEFAMTTRPDTACSDGMSDKVYPIAVTLKVRGEERRGCAEPR
jgi:uncharacterized membrane protein